MSNIYILITKIRWLPVEKATAESPEWEEPSSTPPPKLHIVLQGGSVHTLETTLSEIYNFVNDYLQESFGWPAEKFQIAIGSDLGCPKGCTSINVPKEKWAIVIGE